MRLMSQIKANKSVRARISEIGTDCPCFPPPLPRSQFYHTLTAISYNLRLQPCQSMVRRQVRGPALDDHLLAIVGGLPLRQRRHGIHVLPNRLELRWQLPALEVLQRHDDVVQLGGDGRVRGRQLGATKEGPALQNAWQNAWLR